MADPELNLKVTADISALNAAMQTAQASVSTSAEKMQRSLQNLGNIDFAAQADDLRMQLAILQEMNPIVRAQLEARAALVKLDREARQVSESGGSAGEREIVRLKQAIAGEQARQNIARARQTLIAEIDAKESAVEAKRQSAITRLIQSNQQLAAAVGRTADSMSQRFDQSFLNINRGFGRVSRGAQVGMAAAAAAAGDLDGTIANLPGNLGAVAMAGKTLYDTLHESFTGAKAAAEELNKQLENGQRVVNFRQQTEDMQKQLAIMKERDPLEARRMETERQLAEARRRFNALNTEGATPQAKRALDAEEALIRERESVDLGKIRSQQYKDALRDLEKRQDIQQKENASARQNAIDINAIERDRQASQRRMAMAQDPSARRRIELEQELADIEARRRDRELGHAGSRMERINRDKIAAAERLEAITIATAEYENELAGKRLELISEEQAARQRMRGTLSVETSFGGPMVVGNVAAERGQIAISEKQLSLQQEIRNLVRDLLATQRFGGIQ